MTPFAKDPRPMPLTREVLDELMDENLTFEIVSEDGSIKAELDGTYLAFAGTDPENVPVVKASGDTRAGVWEFTHNSTTGYLYHLLAGASFGGTAAILAIGHDHDTGTGASILLSEKANGKGLVIDQKATKTSATAYGLHATNSSTAAPLVRLEQNVVGAAEALQIISGAAATDQIAVRVTNAAGTVGLIYADTGKLLWKRNIEVRDKDSGTLSRITVRGDDGVPNPSPVILDRTGVEYQTYAGSGTSYWKKRLFHTGNQFKIQGAATVVGIDTAPAWIDGATFEFNTGTAKVGFLGATPVAKQTLPAAATDPATTMALANSLRTALINLGLAQ